MSVLSGTGRTFTIGTLAREAGVNIETIRYYQRRGLLRQPDRPESGARSYSESDLARMRLIKRAQQLGFTLAEILDLLPHVEGGDCQSAREMARGKLEHLGAQIELLGQVRDVLQELVGSCSGGCGDPCPFIRSFRDADLAIPGNCLE